MKASRLAILAALLAVSDAHGQGSLTLNSGDVYTFEFNTLAFSGPWARAMPPAAPVALVTGSLVPGTFQPGSVLLFEIFENTATEPAAASQTLVAEVGGVPGAAFWASDTWQDLQGTMRVSMLSGWGTFDTLNVIAIRDDAGTLIGYGMSALPVPEPNTGFVLAFGFLALMISRRLRAFAPLR